MITNIATGITLASFTDGKQVSTAVSFVLQGNNGGWTTIASDQYDVARANGRVFKRLYDDSDNAVDWSAYTSYRATYALYDPTTQITTTYPNEAQTYSEFDFFPAVFDPSTGKLNATLLDGLIVTATQFADSIGSDNFSSGVSGWQITRAGDAEFNDVVVRGTIYASAGEITGVLTIGASGGIFQGTGTFGSPTTALKIYNSGGIGLWELWGSGTKQVYANSSGQLVAGAGDVTIDADGITLVEPTAAKTDGASLKWNLGATMVADIYSYSIAAPAQTVLGIEIESVAATNAYLLIGSSAPVTYPATLVLQAASHTTTSSISLFADSDASPANYVSIKGTGTGWGVGITGGGYSTTVASLLHLKSAAPTTLWEDATGSAKSLLLTVDANTAQFEEYGGAANDLLVLDLANARVGIGAASPSTLFEVNGISTLPTILGGDGSGETLTLKSTSHATKGKIIFGNAGTSAYDEVNERWGFGTASPTATLNVEGAAIFNDGGANVDFRIEGDTQANLFFVDASADSVGIGTASPSAPLDISLQIGLTAMVIGNNSYISAKSSSGAVKRVFGLSSSNVAYFGGIDSGVDTVYFRTGGTNRVQLDSTGKFGYASGMGGTVTQATNKSTGVTLNKNCGQITMNNAALAANTIVSFTLTNSEIGAGDVLILNHISGGTAGSYLINAQCAAGSASVNVTNITTGSLSEAIVIGFAVIKAVTA